MASAARVPRAPVQPLPIAAALSLMVFGCVAGRAETVTYKEVTAKKRLMAFSCVATTGGNGNVVSFLRSFG